MSSSRTRKRRVLILGIGNYLMGDEGVGIHAVRYLEEHNWQEKADILDGGTGGLPLLSLFSRYERVILIDATADGSTPGTVKVRRPRFAADYPPSLGAHDLGLKDLVEAATLLDELPLIDLVTISIRPEDRLSTRLSEAVQKALPVAEKKVSELLRDKESQR